MPSLHLRPLRLDDEREALAAHEEMRTDNFVFLLGWEGERISWARYVENPEEHRRGLGPRAQRVPSTFLLAEVEGEIVGRVSIRHELNELLLNYGGHIGYGVRPQFRRRGYASEILRLALIVARENGVASALVVCDEGNIASMAVIERLGGVLEDVRPDPDGPPKLRYWIG